jgi:DNA topoisomerase I
MTQTLIIVESPAKCQKIEQYLGPGYKCIASYGHIRQLNGLKSIDFKNNFTPNFVNIESKMIQIKRISQLINKSDKVVLATDDDREGEAIAWHICKAFDLSIATTERIIFHEVTKPALQKSVQNPGFLDMDKVNAQLARQVLDLLVGYKISPILWQCISRKSKKGLSAGRCQTPALRLIYDNQKEIDQSPGNKVYNTTGYFTRKVVPFVLNHNFDNEDAMGDFLEESANFEHKYICSKVKNTTKNPPRPFTTSRIQQTASNEIGCSPKETMKICQRLYEMGKITYMRTDSETYSKDFTDEASKYIIRRWGDGYINENIEQLSERSDKSEKSAKAKKSPKTKKGNKDPAPAAQEAHEAIRPTNVECELLKEELTLREHKMYKLIWRNTVESCMEAAKYYSVTASITCPKAETLYKHSEEQVNFPGWKVVAGYERDNILYAYLQTIKKGSIVTYSKIIAKLTLKNLKTHYTEAKLVQLLEKKGIGRPSTFSSLIDKIQERDYVKKENIKGTKIKCTDFELEGDELNEIETERVFGNEKNKLVIQPLGTLVLEFLIDKFNALFNYEYTANMEQQLDLIAKGEMVWYNLCKICFQQITNLSGEIGELIEEKIKIKIDDQHVYMIGKYGPVIKIGDGDNTSFKSAKRDIDLDKLRRGEYSLEDIMEDNPSRGQNLGVYKDKDVILKKGQFGMYIEWDGKKKS